MKSLNENVKSWLSFSLFVLALVVVRTTIAAPYKIPTGSMIPTLKVGDFILVSKLSYGLKAPIPFTNITLKRWGKPERGDVVVFEFPRDTSKSYIKRLVGLPGDKIEIRQGVLRINGKPAHRERLKDISILNDLVVSPPQLRKYARLYQEELDGKSHYMLRLYPIEDDYGPVTVPEDHYFFMGDNRDKSSDSRFWGFAHKKYLIGQAHYIWLSVNTDQPAMKIGDKFGIPRIRWDRIGQAIK